MSLDSRDSAPERGESESLAGVSEPRRVLVTGASGFLGRAVVARLEHADWLVDAVSAAGPGSDGAGTGTDADSVTWHYLDLLDPGAVDALLEGLDSDHLLHLAWAPNRGIYHSPENFGWVTASAHLVSRFFDNGGRRVVAAGSSAEYDWRAGICRERTTRLGGGGAYGACKRALAELFAGLCEQHASGNGGSTGLSGAWARIFFLFGPHEPEGRLVPAVTRALIKGGPVRCSEGLQVRDYLFVEDAADALVRLLESNLSGPVNIASGEGIRIRDFVRRIAEHTGGADRIEWGAPDEHPFVVADVGRLRNELGWQPPVGLEKGIRKTVAWWSQRLAAEGSPTADAGTSKA